MNKPGSLIWFCHRCGNVEPLQDDGGYEEGDSEPCVNCDDGTAIVRDVADVIGEVIT